MRKLNLAVSSVFFVLSLLILSSNDAFAHHTGDHAVTLHLNNRWKECAIVLDPSLTQNDFNAFADEVSELAYFKPITGAKTLGKNNFEIDLEQRYVKLEDWKPKWNNTFSHPMPDHYLVDDNHILGIPGLRAKMGVTDDTDAELYFTFSPGANYGFAGAAVKHSLIDDANSNWNAAIRGNFLTMFGVEDMKFYQLGGDFIVSKDLWLFRPYLGASLALSRATETTSKVDLSARNSIAPMAIVGTEFNWSYLATGVEASFGKLTIFQVKLGARF